MEMFSKELQEYAQQKYDSRMRFLEMGMKAASNAKQEAGSADRRWLEILKKEIQQKIQACTLEEQILMKFFYGTMPLRDLGEYGFELFLGFVRHGIMLYQTMEWCRNLPEEIFLHHVLYYRINSENIEDCRPFFYQQILDRVRGKALEEAVLEINYWCAENGAYESTDSRTVSPLTMYRCGRGRCGEESVFAVTAFRSVGIPARQVYAPWWSHCDDNHAWVEVYVEGAWYFLGACEPEEALDKGWFVNASSRAMMVYGRDFSDFGAGCLRQEEEPDSALPCLQAKEESNCVLPCIQQEEESDSALPCLQEGKPGFSEPCFWQGEIPYYKNVTARYGAAREFRITVKEEDGTQAAGAKIFAEVLNGAEYRSIAAVTAGLEGETSLCMGLGTIHLWAAKEGRTCQMLVDTREQTEAALTLKETEPTETGRWFDMEFQAPEENLAPSPSLTREQKERNRKRLQKAAALRARRIDGYYHKALAENYPDLEEIFGMAGENIDQLYQFLERDSSPDRKRLIYCLSEKDYKDAKADVLEEHLQYASQYRREWEEKGELWIYENYILCPRIYFEEMTCYRKWVEGYFSDEEKAQFQKNPEAVWEYIKAEITYDETQDYSTIYSTPAGTLKLKFGNPMSQRILCAAICRTLGIPARVDQAAREVEVYKDGNFIRISGTEKAALILKRKKGEEWKFGQNWTIGRLCGDCFVTLDYQKLEFEGMALELELEPGYYRILTANRLPNGNQLASEYRVVLKPGSTEELGLRMRTGRPEELLVSHPLEDFEVWKDGAERKISALTKEGVHILAFLEPGQEPTEHVLNEMAMYHESLRRLKASICFIVRGQKVQKTEAWNKALKAVPEIAIAYGSVDELAEPLARSMYVDPDKLPLLLIVNPGLQGIYACSGYQAGSVKLMLELLRVNERSGTVKQY